MSTITATARVALSKVKPGDYVRLSAADSGPVWIKGHYLRTSRMYSLTSADDINREIFRKAAAQVFAGFTY